ncbi:MAG: response regulator [Bacteroidota bacterium]
MKAEKLFLVDDDFIFRETAEVLIKTSDLAKTIFKFENGLEAYNALTELSLQPDTLPDIVLLDINMPIMNGWELLEEIRRESKMIMEQVQIYILTSSIAPEDLNLSKEYDFISGYITKPLTKADIKMVKEKLQKQKTGTI